MFTFLSEWVSFFWKKFLFALPNFDAINPQKLKYILELEERLQIFLWIVRKISIIWNYGSPIQLGKVTMLLDRREKQKLWARKERRKSSNNKRQSSKEITNMMKVSNEGESRRCWKAGLRQVRLKVGELNHPTNQIQTCLDQKKKATTSPALSEYSTYHQAMIPEGQLR